MGVGYQSGRLGIISEKGRLQFFGHGKCSIHKLLSVFNLGRNWALDAGNGLMFFTQSVSWLLMSEKLRLISCMLWKEFCFLDLTVDGKEWEELSQM